MPNPHPSHIICFIARHFLSSCTRVLGLHSMPNGVEFEGRLVHVGTFPIGIDPEKFAEGMEKPSIKQRIARLEAKFAGTKILVGVDRLDYIKGVPQKLHALELFLSKHPEWVEKVVLVQVAVPSRQDVEEYQRLQQVVNELVGRINGRFGTVDYMPIHFMHKSVTFDELVALYAISDACIVSSTRDGMNLVSYEYIACQQQRHGVMVLSEFAGAAQSLNGSIIVNPWNTEELAQAIYDAVTMDDKARAQNHQKLYRYVTKYTAAYWGLSFVTELTRVAAEYDSRMALPKLDAGMVVQKYNAAKGKKIVLLDYDGTLTATHKLAEYAKPSAHILDMLRTLAAKKDTYVYVLSGRSRMHLERWFEGTGVGLSAEHGCFYKHPPKLLEAIEGESPRSPEVAEPEDLHGMGEPSMPVPGSASSSSRQRTASSAEGPLQRPITVGEPYQRARAFSIGSDGASKQRASFSEGSPRGRVPSGNSPGLPLSPGAQRFPSMTRRRDNGWFALVDPVDSSWRETIRPLFQHYTERTPGSFIEEKEVGLVDISAVSAILILIVASIIHPHRSTLLGTTATRTPNSEAGKLLSSRATSRRF